MFQALSFQAVARKIVCLRMIRYYVRGFVNLLFIPETRFFIVEIQALDNSGDWETAKSTAFFTGSVFEQWTD